MSVCGGFHGEPRGDTLEERKTGSYGAMEFLRRRGSFPSRLFGSLPQISVVSAWAGRYDPEQVPGERRDRAGPAPRLAAFSCPEA